ncbi:MAG: sugar ABC transporter substrate-binding protein [Acidobacteriota bacterium]
MNVAQRRIRRNRSTRIGSGLGLCLLLILAACRQVPPPSEAQPTVALVVKTLNNPFFLDMQKGAQEAAQRLGVALTVQAAERELDVEKQMQIIENLIQSRVSALCLTPSGSREVVPAIVKANQAGIPVLILDTRVHEETLQAAGGRVACFIGSDNYQGGKLAGEFLMAKTGGKANVAVLEGIPGHETGDSRLKGFHDALRGHPGMRIVASQTANWERDQGYNVFQNILQAHPEVEALFACSDLMALGAVEAIAAARRTKSITVVGFDAFSEARDAVRQGLMAATVAQSPEKMGQLAVETAVRLTKGESVPEDIPVEIHLVTPDSQSVKAQTTSP